MNLNPTSARSEVAPAYTRSAAAAAPSAPSQEATDSVQLGGSSAPASSGDVKLNPRELGEKQFADSFGRVTNLALMLSPYAGGRARSQMLNAYKTLFNKMEPDTKFTITVQTEGDRKDIQKAIKDSGCPNPERITFIKPDVGGLTVWARDMMVPLQLTNDKDHVALLGQQPLHDWHDNDKAVPVFISKANPTILLDDDKSLVTDGGDVMANTKESFVGYYSLSATAQKLSKTVESDRALEARFVETYEQATGKHVVDEGRAVVFPFVREERSDAAENPTALSWHLAANPEFKQTRMAEGQVTKAEMYEDVATQMFSQKFGKPVTVVLTIAMVNWNLP